MRARTEGVFSSVLALFSSAFDVLVFFCGGDFIGRREMGLLREIFALRVKNLRIGVLIIHAYIL